MTEMVKHKDSSISLDHEPILIEISESDKGKMDYFKSELDRMKGIEKTIKNLNDKYVQSINEKAIIKTKYDKERELNQQLITELNMLKAYKTLVDITCNCQQLNKKINIFDCNRGYNNFCRNRDNCTTRRILIEDIKNKYLE